MLPVSGKRARGLQRFDGWVEQAGVGPSLAGMVSLVSCGLRCRGEEEIRAAVGTSGQKSAQKKPFP